MLPAYHLRHLPDAVRGRSLFAAVSNYAFCWISLGLFLVGGLINGFLLFGHPLGSGQLINWGVSFVIGLCLVLGKDDVHPKYIQSYEK